jgi:beta-galactosidase
MSFGMIRFMRKFSTLVLALVCSFNSFARESTLLDSGWRFVQGDPAGLSGQAMSPADPNWIDSSWQTVSIPHCWGWEDAQQGKDYYRGPGWYRRELDIVPETGKRYFLRFESASLVANVYLNGKLLGEHRGGFGAFCFEITTHLSASGTNLLAVRVDNTKFPDVAPLSGDFSVYGGLYRPVHLLVTGEEDFTPLDHASPGVAWLQTSVSKTSATLDVTAQISNGTKKNQSQTLVATVLDANGNPVARSEEKITLAPGMTAPYWLRVTVPQPHLKRAQRPLSLQGGGGIARGGRDCGFGRTAAGTAVLFGGPGQGILSEWRAVSFARRGQASRSLQQGLGGFRGGFGRGHFAHQGNGLHGGPLRALSAQ